MARKSLQLLIGMGMVIVGILASCEAAERTTMVAPQPGDSIIIDKSTSLRLDRLAEDSQSALMHGWSFVTADGVFSTTTITDGGNPAKQETKVGGRSNSDGRVLHDTIKCGENFIEAAFTLAGEPAESDFSTPDSIGNKVVKTYNGADGQVLNTEDAYRFLNVSSTLPTPNYQPTSEVSGVRYENGTDENSRIVWVEITVKQDVVGTTAGTAFDQTYEVGYVQVKDAQVVPQDPLKIKINVLEMFRTYRPRDQHSVMDLWMSYDVINAKTGEIVENIDTDSRMAAKIGHYGSPRNGYSLEEMRLIGTAPTEVTEELDPNNEEAKKASKQIGKFNFQVDAYKQSYYVRFPVRGRDDSEGGKEAGGERLLFQLNGSYVDPDLDYRFDFQITHRTEVVVKGWEQRTPDYQRPNDPGITYEYLSSYVVEFIDHLYLNGEEIVWVDSDEGVFYYLVPSQNGKNIEVTNPDYELYYTGSDAHPFHTSNMVVDGWKPIFE